MMDPWLLWPLRIIVLAVMLAFIVGELWLCWWALMRLIEEIRK